MSETRSPDDAKPIVAREVRHNRWVMGLALAPLLAIPVLAGLAIALTPMTLVVVPHLAMLGGFASWLTWKMNPWARRVPVEASVGSEALVITEGGATRTIDRAAITRGARVPSATGATVEITAKRARGAKLEMSDDDAKRLLAQLGLDASQTTATFRGMSRVYAKGWYLFAAFAAIFPAMAAMGALSAVWRGAGLLAPVFVVAFLAVMFMRTRIDVGGDGVLVRWMGRDRFIAHGDIQRVEVTEHGFGRSRRKVVVLHLSDGEALNLPTGNPRVDAQNAELLAARILEAQAARKAGTLAPAAMLFRGERSLAEWVAELRRRDAVDLRTPAVSKDDLWRVIEDVTAQPVDRGAAAVALGKALPAPERMRLAQVAKAVAAPKLRVVLERSVEAEDEELAEMLEELEARKGA